MTFRTVSPSFRRLFLPALVFLLVWAVHYVWLGLFPEQSAVQNQWVAVGTLSESSWWHRYIENKDYYLSFSYAFALGFATLALIRYRQEQLCSARNLAIGGITLSGALGLAGCFLLGCCGSPMLAVYISLFGVASLPLAKPILAALTTASIGTGWWWMNRAYRKARCTDHMPSQQTNCSGGGSQLQ